MGSTADFLEYVTDQIARPDHVASRKMFGEYALYYDGKVVALICDNQLFVKPTAEGRAYAGRVTEAPPYPGAKDYLLIDDNLDNGEWVAGLIEITAAALPLPKKKKRRNPSYD